VSDKQPAHHGPSLEDRLRALAPHTDDEALMVEAANTIQELRELRIRVTNIQDRGLRADAWDEGHHAGVWNATHDGPGSFRDNPYREDLPA